jgi:hypothetical protein
MQRAPAFLLKNGGERAALIEIRGYDENLGTAVHGFLLRRMR